MNKKLRNDVICIVNGSYALFNLPINSFTCTTHPHAYSLPTFTKYTQHITASGSIACFAIFQLLIIMLGYNTIYKCMRQKLVRGCVLVRVAYVFICVE